MQPVKPAYPPPPSYGMGAPQQPVAWNMQHPAPQQPEQDGCLRTSVLVTGIIHIVISIFPTNVLGIIAGCFQITGASTVRTTSNVFPLISGGKVALNCLRPLPQFNATFPPILREKQYVNIG